MDILLDHKNKSAQDFLIYRIIQDGRQGSKVQNRPNLTPITLQITFRLCIWILFIRFGQNLAWTYYLTLQTSLHKNFSFIAISKMAAGGQRSKIYKFDPTSQISARHLDLVNQIRTKFGMNIELDPSNKPAQEFFIYRKIQDGRRGSKNQTTTKFDPTNHISARHLVPVHQIWTKFGMNILLDPSNKPD